MNKKQRDDVRERRGSGRRERICSSLEAEEGSMGREWEG
jgi:hypothetical protein